MYVRVNKPRKKTNIYMTLEQKKLDQNTEPKIQGIEVIKRSSIPFFESKSKPGIFYYFTFGFSLKKESIEKGDPLLNSQPVKCFSIENYNHVQKIPDEIIDDIALVEDPSIQSLSQKKNTLAQFYYGEASNKNVVVYKLTDF